MKIKYTTATVFTLAIGLGLAPAGCGDSDSGDSHAHGPDSHDHTPASQQPALGGDTHTHADGSTHAAHDPDPASHSDASGDHSHHEDEVALDPATIGEMTVELAQGHGAVEPGKEGHLIVKLPYNDNGATIVRAWIGSEDRTLSFVGKGEYAASHDDYDIHAMAPNPLPEGVLWWIELEMPNGSKVVGFAKPILE